MKIIKIFIKMFLFLFLFATVICFYAIYIEPHMICTKEVTLTHQKENIASETLTMVQFSDTHLGFHFDLEELQKAVNAINQLEPDFVFFTGDLIDIAREYDRVEQVAPILAQINATYGKFAVYGNHDYGGGAQRHYQQILKDSDFQLLVNDTVPIHLPNGEKIGISGLDETFFGDPQPNLITTRFADYDYNILLLHEPDVIDTFMVLPELAVAGHSHGGQIRIPFYGPLTTTRYAEKYMEGKYVLDDNRMLYVNVGLGTTKLPMRFADIPELTVYRLKMIS